MSRSFSFKISGIRTAPLLVACLWLLGWQPTTAAVPTQTDSPTITATVSRDDVQVAEPFEFELTVNATAGTRIVMPAIGNQLGEFEVIDIQKINDLPSEASPEQRIWSQRIKLESIVTGDLEIPGLEIQAIQDDNRTTYNSDPVAVRVISVLEDRADPTQFRDIQSVIDAAVPEATSNSWVWWGVGGLGLFAFAAMAAVVAVRRKKWISPSQWAIGELDDLQDSVSVEPLDSASICHELSRITRDYLELQFEIAAPEQTTEELLKSLSSAGIVSPAVQQQFLQIFEATDQVKFAGLSPTPEELKAMIAEARDVVEQTSELAASDNSTTGTNSGNKAQTISNSDLSQQGASN